MIDKEAGTKKDLHSEYRISKTLDENSDAMYVAMGGPKTSQHIIASTKSLKIIKASFCFLSKFFKCAAIKFILRVQFY